MKKRLLLIISILMLFIPVIADAASGSIKATSSSSKITLNNTFTVTVNVNSTDPLGSWDYTLTYDSSKLSLQKGDTRVVGYGDGSYSSKSYSYTFKAIGLGSATIGISSAKIADWNTDSFISTTPAGTTVNISNPVNIVYSSDNHLTDLSVDDYKLEPQFDKNVLEYTLTTKPGITSVNISAKTSHSKAKIEKTGSFDVVEGENIIPIVVKAENGSTKTYTIKLTVPEKDPIEVNINNKKINILRKLPEDLPIDFIEKTIIINEEEVPALYSEKLKITLVYVRDEKGKNGYYTFENTKVSEKFTIINSKDISIYLNKTENILKGFKKSILEIDNQKIDSYQITKNSKYYIIYGTDLLTNKSNYYSYDSINKTLQIYDQETHDYFQNQLNEKMIIIYALGGSLIIFILITILLSRNKSKIKKIEAKLEPKKTKLEEKKKK